MPSYKNLPLNHIFIPSKVPSKKIMIILHGRGDSSQGFTFLPEYLNIDDMNYILLLDTLFEEEFNAKESFLFGFSQGSLLTFEFGARYKKVLAGYIAISGYIYDADTLIQEMNPNVKASNWLCTHGIYDDVLPYNTSKAQVEVLQNDGFDIEFKSYKKTHTIAEDELLMLKGWIKSK